MTIPIDTRSSRFDPANRAGFYESYFQRANHPSLPLAFWIRYTVFCPKGSPQNATGELWAIYFDGQADRITAVKENVPIADCRFGHDRLDVHIADSALTDRRLDGRARSGSDVVGWALDIAGGQAPVLLMPSWMYGGSFPKAKVLVISPNATFTGSLKVNGEDIPVDGWRGSQNHNWGSRHTDRYAWGQVAGFDDAPDTFLECSTAQLRVGPLWTPRMSLLVLRHEGEEIVLNSLGQSLRASGRFEFSTESFHWQIDSKSAQAHVSGRFEAPRSAFVGLRYLNPPGGDKTCLNCKLASAQLTVRRPGRPTLELVTRHRAAFEILTDRKDHGVEISI